MVPQSWAGLGQEKTLKQVLVRSQLLATKTPLLATPFCVLFFLFSSYDFLDDIVWGQIPSHLWLRGSCAA